jgi:hypothetical protein
MGFNKISDEHVEMIEGFTDFLQQPTATFFDNSHSEIEKKLEEILNMFKQETLF